MGIDVALNDIKKLTPNYTVSVYLPHCPGLLSLVTQARLSRGDMGTESPSRGPLTQRIKKDFPRGLVQSWGQQASREGLVCDCFRPC